MSATEVEIGVWVDGSQKWVSGVTRRTTCYDLIRALLRAQNLRATDEDVIKYIIVERWKKVERPLDHEQRILKVWKSWGETVHQVRFSLRRGRGDSPETDDNPKKKNKHIDQDWDKNKENDANLDGSLDGAESSCGRSERSRRRHKMRQSRREATACLQRVPPLPRHRSPAHTTEPEDSPQPLSDDESDSRDCGTSKHAKPESRRPAKDDPRYNETMERLMRLVVAQGETIQNQLRRLNQRESQIESYEQQMHLLRVQSLGNDYLLSSYLHDQHHQAQDQPHGMEQVMGVDSGSKYSSHHRNSLLPPARLQSGPHVQFNQAHPTLLPSMSDTREVHAKPINIGGGPNDLFIQDAATCINTAGRNNFVRSMKSTEPLRYSGRLNRSNKDETLDEEKSKDSGILFAEETDDISHRDIEDLNEAEVQERLALFNKMETILNRMLEEEEKIHGLRSTIEVIQTQQKQEKNILECDLKRAADDHAALVAEVRSNEQQIRVLDTSAAQKKKLIDALLADEVDSDQETKYLQAKLDYILHLPPTAFRLPEEGDDPPPLPPPPAHPACLVQSLLPNHPPQLVNPITTSYRQPSPNQQKSSSQTQTNKHFHSRSSSSDNRPPCGASHRPPSPNVLYNNRAPSPSIFGTVNRAPSPGPRLPNRSCSPNRRKPLQPPPYEHHKLNGNLTTIDSTSVPLLRSSVSGSNPTLQSQINNKNFQSSYSLKNTFTSVNVLPNRTDLSLASNQNLNSSEQNQNTNSLKNINSIHLRINTFKKQVGEDNDEDVPPPLPLCPPPLLTPPANAKDIMQSNTYNIKSDMNGEKSRTDFSNNEASKRNLLNTIGSRIVSGKSSKSVDDDDNDSTTNNSSLGLSSRSSTSSEASMSNCSSSVSSGVGVDSFPSSNINKMQRTRNQISAVNGKDSSVKSHSLLLQNNSITSSTDQLVLSGTTDVKKDSDSGDSNSDTGLSSLHSSSDEAAYALDTLV